MSRPPPPPHHHHGNIWITNRGHRHSGINIPTMAMSHQKQITAHRGNMNPYIYPEANEWCIWCTCPSLPNPNKEPVSETPTFQTTQCNCALLCLYVDLHLHVHKNRKRVPEKGKGQLIIRNLPEHWGPN